MSSSVHSNNKGRDIIVLGEDQRKDQLIPQQQQRLYIQLILQNQIKDLYEVYTIKEATGSNLLMLQIYIISKQKNSKKRLCAVFR